MKMTEWFLAELESEAAKSRRVLEQVPTGKRDWKPHERSMELGYLSELVANIPSWVGMAITLDELDIAPKGLARARRLSRWALLVDPAFEAIRGPDKQELVEAAEHRQPRLGLEIRNRSCGRHRTVQQPHGTRPRRAHRLADRFRQPSAHESCRAVRQAHAIPILYRSLDVEDGVARQIVDNRRGSSGSGAQPHVAARHPAP